MLKQLSIKNIILIEEAVIEFHPGMNVLSGETGAGKSAIIGALSLIAGERSQIDMIRKGYDKGVVEAIFELDHQSGLTELLQKAGIEQDETCELIIRREISIAGKNRIYINHQLAQLTLLKQAGEFLFELVGQHANQQLFSIENHRKIVDAFGDLTDDVNNFSKQYKTLAALKEELELLLNGEGQRLREIERSRMELEQFQEINFQEGEEEQLFSEYKILAHADELNQRVSEIKSALNGEKAGALPLLQKVRFSWENLIKIDPALTEMSTSFQNALIELQEISYSLDRYQDHIDSDPARMSEIDQRLGSINKFKRKYGTTLTEITTYFKNVEQKLIQLESADERIEQLRASVAELEEKNKALANQLTTRRKKIAKSLEKAVTNHLHDLNMPKAEFFIEISPQACSSTGEDKVEFHLLPNVGEKHIPLKSCASGGELSRILLALKVLLSSKALIPTLVFDEIDANIGGATAHVIGEKLKEIGQEHQVLCVTHFPQVAKHADHHLQISKMETQGRTLTTITTLNEETRDLELARMQGIV